LNEVLVLELQHLHPVLQLGRGQLVDGVAVAVLADGAVAPGLVPLGVVAGVVGSPPRFF
jgi:hypothetical protein